MSRAAYKLLGEPRVVELLTDTQRGLMGIRAGSDDSPNGYRVQQPSRLVAARLFTKSLGVDLSVSRRRTAQLEGDVLCVDLREDGDEVHGNRRPRPTA